MPIKVFNNQGNGATTLSLAAGMDWAVGLEVDDDIPVNPNPANILNLSLGAPGVSETLNDAVDRARSEGAIVIAASGNLIDDPADRAYRGVVSPANAPGALAVGSVNSNYQRSFFSIYSLEGPTVDVMGPGGFTLQQSICNNHAVVSTVLGDDYGCFAGTSMAAPFVSGVAALVWSQNPNWTADQVMDRLLESTFQDPSWDEQEYGQGVLCADKALGASTTCGQ